MHLEAAAVHQQLGSSPEFTCCPHFRKSLRLLQYFSFYAAGNAAVS